MIRKVLPLITALVLLWACGEADNGGQSLGDFGDPRDLGDPMDPRFIGVWRSLSSLDSEGYDIDEATLTYTDGDTTEGWGFDYHGVIRYTKRFTDQEGVIIIEYTEDGWPQYTMPGHTVSPWVGHPIPGPFFGIYYSDLTQDRVVMANATTLDSVPPYKPPETKTLEEAIEKFTLSARDRFVAGVATPQFRFPGTED